MLLTALALACTPIATDGDSVRLCDERIRIADIDAPEIQGQCPSERALAIRARDRLAVLLREGEVEYVRVGNRERDRYGRLLRVVVRNGRSIGDQLVAEGLARTWSGRREPWC